MKNVLKLVHNIQENISEVRTNTGIYEFRRKPNIFIIFFSIFSFFFCTILTIYLFTKGEKVFYLLIIQGFGFIPLVSYGMIITKLGITEKTVILYYPFRKIVIAASEVKNLKLKKNIRLKDN